jgi:hypothetical protein
MKTKCGSEILGLGTLFFYFISAVKKTAISRHHSLLFVTRKGKHVMKHIVFLTVTLFFILSTPLVSAASDLNISIGIVPPPFVYEEPPDVVVVPSGPSYVYMVPDTVGLYFYNGYWYRFHKRHWYRSTIYNGAWTYINTSIVPGVILDVPPDYILRLPSGYHRIHYRDLHKNWRKWGRSRHWHRYDWYKHRWRERDRRHRPDYRYDRHKRRYY